MKNWISAALAASVMLGGSARAGDEDGSKVHQITARRVTPAETAAVFPKAAFDQKISGSAVLNCTADEAGREVDCRIVEEDPPGMGFGEAALVLVTKERVKTKDASGASIIGRRFETAFEFLAPGDSNPDWMKKPTAGDLAGVFPKAAAKKRVDGKAIIKCQLDVQGFLQKCMVMSEEPAGLGFGEAALQLSPQFRMTPKIRGGKPVPSDDLVIPIAWKGFSDAHLTASGNSLVLDPPWVSTPTAQQVRDAWPANAKDAGAGQVALRCGFNKTGVLDDCVTISEIPAGRGFAKAARSLTSSFKVRFSPDQAKTLDDYSVDVPFRFRDPAGPDTRKITAPKWTRSLTSEGMALVYPEAAAKAGVKTGLGVIACVVNVQGELTECEVRREDPAGLDFGAAAIEASKAMAMNPWSKEGEPLDGLSIVLPIRFNWQEAAADAASTAPPAKP
jgi:hypothetical protein